MVRFSVSSIVAIVSVAGFLGVGFLGQEAIAQPPEVLQHFRILPRHSTLHETGGFAGLDNEYRLTGSYDLQLSAFPWGSASFANAEVWGSLISDHPTPAIVLDVDDVLNLEDLEGVALPVGALFDVFRFTGFLDDGLSELTLYGIKLGPWMYLRGESRPPVGGADFIEYELRALARTGRFADANGDGRVDAADYTSLRDRLGHPSSDGASLADWKDQFGEVVPDMDAMDLMMTSAMASLELGSTTVPEPATALLAVIGLVLCGAIRAQKR